MFFLIRSTYQIIRIGTVEMLIFSYKGNVENWRIYFQISAFISLRLFWACQYRNDLTSFSDVRRILDDQYWYDGDVDVMRSRCVCYWWRYNRWWVLVVGCAFFSVYLLLVLDTTFWPLLLRCLMIMNKMISIDKMETPRYYRYTYMSEIDGEDPRRLVWSSIMIRRYETDKLNRITEISGIDTVILYE